MSIEIVNFIDELNAANPSPSDSIGEAYRHIQLIKSALKKTFRTSSEAITLTDAEIDQIPVKLLALESKIAVAYTKLKQLEAATPDKQNADDHAKTVAQSELLGGTVLLMLPASRTPPNYADINSPEYQFLNPPTGANKTNEIKILKAVAKVDA